MLRFALIVIAFAVGIGVMLPSEKPAPSAAVAQAQKPGVFEPSPYKETQLSRRSDGHFYATADVNGASITFLVDTGASTIALSEGDARAAGLQFSNAEFEPVARTANGIARGKAVTLPKVSIEGKDVTEVEAMIVEGAEMSLLGQSYLSRLASVEMNRNVMTLR